MLMVFKLNRNCTFVKKSFQKTKERGSHRHNEINSSLEEPKCLPCNCVCASQFGLCSDPRSHTTRRAKPFNNTT